MKKYLFLMISLVLSQFAFSQCSELYFSEYVEGNQSNKAMEIYNPTSSDINLSNYQIHRWSNGSDIHDPLYTQVLSGTIPAKGVWVVVKDTSPSEIVYYSLRSKANAFLTPSCATGAGINRTFCHNGNDAITLEKVAGDVVVDIFGQIGFDPGEPNIGAGWNSNPATNYSTPDSSGSAWTTDHTLIRKFSVMTGVTSNPAGSPSTNSFNVTVEWDSFKINTFDSLGHHYCACKDYTGIISPINNLQVETYPNPATDYIVINSAESSLSELTIMSINGKVAYHEELTGDNKTYTINLVDHRIAQGEYLLFIKAKNGANLTKAIAIIK